MNMHRLLWQTVILALLWGFMMAAPVAAEGPDDFEMRLVKVFFDSKAQLNALASSLDIWEVHQDEGYFVARVHPAELEMLQQMGVQVQFFPEMTHRLYLNWLMLPGQTGGIPGYACYRTVEETYRDLANLAAAYPQLATWKDIGDSWTKATSGGLQGYDLYALQITSQSRPGPKPKILIIAAIHAREYATAELVTRFAEKLVHSYGQDPDITWLLDYFEVHVIPQANPDGRKHAEQGQLWRKNTDNDDGCDFDRVEWGYYYGVDLNRNSSFQWNRGGSSANACDETYRGPSAGSEPEVQAIETYARTLFPDQRGPDLTDAAPDHAEGVFISVHSFGELVLFPWDWTDTQPAPNRDGLQTLGRKFGFFNHYEVCSDCLYNASGTTVDFVYGELGVASYTFEIGNTFFQDCSLFEQDIIPRNMPALLYAVKSARQPYLSPKGPDTLLVSLNAETVRAGKAVTLTATVDDSRYFSGGYGEEPVQAIQAARYTIDEPGWLARASWEMTATDGAFDTPQEKVIATIDTTGLAPGRHIIFVQGQDALGNWGPPTAVFLTIQEDGAHHRNPARFSSSRPRQLAQALR